ncbi:transposase [Nonomuraea sp. NPDC001636]|uniref:transposase n=1 Tax=Nonomuraea sp. NPDC001636 TaxID=3154391 RepID=UPI00332F926B
MIEPLLPQRQRRFRHPGRKRLDDMLALQSILFVLHTGIACQHLPQELGHGSGMTCWRRLAEWNASGVWQWLHEVLLDRLRAADALD